MADVLFDVASTTTGDANNPLQWNHTVADGDNRCLRVCISITWTGTKPTVTGVTYGGDALSFIGAIDNTGSLYRRVEIWQMVAPQIGTHQVSVVFATNPTRTVGASSSWTGVSQTAPSGAFFSAKGYDAAPTVDVSSATGEAVVDAINYTNGGTTTPTATGTPRWSDFRMTTRSAGQSKDGAATVTMNWSLSGLQYWCIGAASLKPAATVIEVTPDPIAAILVLPAPTVELLQDQVNPDSIAVPITCPAPALTGTGTASVSPVPLVVSLILPVPIVGMATIEGVSTAGTSTYSRATRTPMQHKGFYAAGRFWQFYYDAPNAYYTSSTDGITWATRIAVTAIRLAANFSTVFDGTYFHYVYEDSTNGGAYYRRGLPNSDGSVTWSAAEQTIMASGYAAGDPSIAVDSNGYPWVVLASNTGVSWVFKSSKTDGTWTTDNSWNLGGSAWNEIVALTSGKMYCITLPSNTGKIKGKLYDGTNWGDAENINTTYASVDYYSHASAIAIGDDVYIAWLVQTSYGIKVIKRTYGVGTGSEETVLASGVLASSPVITYNPVTGDIYVFWVSAPTVDHVYYRKHTASGWELVQDWFTEPVALYTKGTITCYPKMLDGRIGVAWTTGAASPYNVRHGYMVLPTGSEIIPDPMTIPIALPNPTVGFTGTIVAAPSPIPSYLALPTPQVSLTGTEEVWPNPVAAPIVLPDPVVAALGTVTIVPDPITVLLGLPNPVVVATADAEVIPDPVEMPFVEPDPVVSIGTFEVTPDPHALVLDLMVPLVIGSGLAEIVPDPVGVLFALPVPHTGFRTSTQYTPIENGWAYLWELVEPETWLSDEVPSGYKRKTGGRKMWEIY